MPDLSDIRFNFALQLVGQRLQRQSTDAPGMPLPEAQPVIDWAYDVFDKLVTGNQPTRVTPAVMMPGMQSPKFRG